ncbi:uncharacterized protein LOC108666719 [Hyalella azteca]|uniref:Uncharacterized protein LOC108666719 n=1 Tax=Hyalella azteca TaxID=294128 RepID=A0A8B7N768_HYAAZ|nr:uncharacterized protein LOC108666719 [Hyalella azteca]
MSEWFTYEKYNMQQPVEKQTSDQRREFKNQVQQQPTEQRSIRSPISDVLRLSQSWDVSRILDAHSASKSRSSTGKRSSELNNSTFIEKVLNFSGSEETYKQSAFNKVQSQMPAISGRDSMKQIFSVKENKMSGLDEISNGGENIIPELLDSSKVFSGEETVVETLNSPGFGISHHSPLFIRSKFRDKISKIHLMNSIRIIRRNNSLASVPNDNRIIHSSLAKSSSESILLSSTVSSLNGRQSSVRCGRPRFIPQTLENVIDTSNDTSEMRLRKAFGIIEKKKEVSMKANQPETKSAFSSIFTKLGSRSKIASDVSREEHEPIPLQVEDLRHEKSDDFIRKITSASLVQMQLQEIKDTDLDLEQLRMEDEFMTAPLDRPAVDDELGSVDRASWMGQLPDHVKQAPLQHLFIPGSHDSCTASLTGGEMGPDVSPGVRRLGRACPCIAQPAFLRWSVTQRATLTEQLTNGVRYFDLRVAELNGRLHFVHGLYGDDIQLILEEISLFLFSHSSEVVLLDFQHLYDLTPQLHRDLVGIIQQVFQGALCPVMPPYNLNLAFLQKKQYQALVFYRSDDVSEFPENFLWTKDMMPNPWPHTSDAKEMIEFLARALDARNLGLFHVTQCVLTPSMSSFMLRHLCSTLEAKMAIPANTAVLKNLPLLADREGGCNILMADFVDFKDYALPKAIIRRNFEKPE